VGRTSSKVRSKAGLDSSIREAIGEQVQRVHRQIDRFLGALGYTHEDALESEREYEKWLRRAPESGQRDVNIYLEPLGHAVKNLDHASAYVAMEDWRSAVGALVSAARLLGSVEGQLAGRRLGGLRGAQGRRRGANRARTETRNAAAELAVEAWNTFSKQKSMSRTAKLLKVKERLKKEGKDRSISSIEKYISKAR
jgi:hypothetical protein